MTSVLEQLAESAHLLAGLDEGAMLLPPKVRQLLRAALVTFHDDQGKVLTSPAAEVALEDGCVPTGILELSGKMVAVCKQFRGQGLAAPQVGQGLRLIVFHSTLDRQWYAVLNPQLIRHGQDSAVAEEGCLSLPGLRVQVRRWHLCEVEGIVWKVRPEIYDASTRSGEARRFARVRLNLRGVDARCLQHELDHLDGVLILHKAESA